MHKTSFAGAQQAIIVKCAVAISWFVAFCFLGSAEDLIRIFRERNLLPNGYCYSFTRSAFDSDMLTSFLPILVVIPFSGTYVEDVKSKFSRFFLIRSNYFSYLFSRIFICFLCGGCTCFLGGLLSWFGAALLFCPLERVEKAGETLTEQIWPVLALLFMNGGFWAILGMTMSTIMESKYIAYASPFIVYYFLIILYDRYFPNAWLLSPKNWWNPEIWPYGVGSAVLFLMELTFLCGLVFYIRGKRRLEQL